MKFGQVIECNMKNIFLEKLYTQCSGEATLFWKIKIEHISGSQQSKVLYSLLSLYDNMSAIEI